VTSENNKLFTLKGLELISGDSEDTEIFGLAVNSQDVGSGYLFIALQGSVQHGAYYS